MVFLNIPLKAVNAISLRRLFVSYVHKKTSSYFVQNFKNKYLKKTVNWSKLKRIVMRLQNIIGIILHQMKSGSRRRAINLAVKMSPVSISAKIHGLFNKNILISQCIAT